MSLPVEKRQNRIHGVLYALLLLLGLLLQYVPGVLPRVWGSGTPSVLLVVVICTALCKGEVYGGAMGLAAGILCDLNAVHGKGYFAITYLLTGLVVGLLVSYLVQNNPLSCGGVGVLAVVCNLTLYWLIFSAFAGLEQAGRLYTGFYLPLIGYTLLFLYPIYGLCYQISRSFGKPKKKTHGIRVRQR